MTDPAHPSLDDLADLHEGLLPARRAHDIAAHVSACHACSAASAALDDVTHALSVVGSSPLPMPSRAATSLDEALQRASAERSPTVSSLSQYRASSRRETVARRRSPWTWVAGAAAVVAFGYAGATVLDSTSDSAESAGDTTTAAETESRRGGMTSKDDRPSSGFLPQASDELRAVTRKTLPGFAGALATRTEAADTTAGECPSVGVSDGDKTAVVRWRGARAVVVVDPGARRVTVYRCTGDADRLFATRY